MCKGGTSPDSTLHAIFRDACYFKQVGQFRAARHPTPIGGTLQMELPASLNGISGSVRFPHRRLADSQAHATPFGTLLPLWLRRP